MATVLEESNGKLTVGRVLGSIAAVIAGSVTIGILAFGVSAVLRQFFPAVFTTDGGDASPEILAFILLYTAVFSAFGGYLTAALSKRSPMKHVIALGILQLIGGIAAVIQAGNDLPRWYAAAVIIFPIPVICLGGYLKARTRQG